MELALDDKGRFLALRGSVICNTGAHSVMYVPLVKCAELLSSVYRVPTAHIRARAALTNTPPTNPYRSAGRPEAIYAIERVIDIAAKQFGYDRIDLRRRNLIPPSAQPYANPLGMTYDCGDYGKIMDRALALSDWKGFTKRRRESKRGGKLRGIGLANYLEITSGSPREWSKVDVKPEGQVEVFDRHAVQRPGPRDELCAMRRRMARRRCRQHQADPGRHRHRADRRRLAFGTLDAHGRRRHGQGVASGHRQGQPHRRGRCWRPMPADVAFAEGRFTVKGTDRSIGLFEVARAARERNDLPEDLRGPLAADCEEFIRMAAFPFGCAVCEVEIDPDTGQVEIVRYTAIDDVGRAINPMILHGQTHGGIAQGVGQALWEHSHYDPQSGQLLAGSMMDYAMPRAQ